MSPAVSLLGDGRSAFTLVALGFEPRGEIIAKLEPFNPRVRRLPPSSCLSASVSGRGRSPGREGMGVPPTESMLALLEAVLGEEGADAGVLGVSRRLPYADAGSIVPNNRRMPPGAVPVRFIPTGVEVPRVLTLFPIPWSDERRVDERGRMEDQDQERLTL